MARIVYIIGTLYGSVGGSTFQKNASGYIVRQRPQLSKKSTLKQYSAHNKLQNWLANWNQLGGTNQMAWNVFAMANPKTNKFGQVKNITGANWFMSVNYMRTLLGLTVLDSPPTYTIPDAAPNFEIELFSDNIKINFLGSFDYTNNSLIVWVTPPTNRTTVSVNQIRKFSFTQASTPANPLTITSNWQSTIGINWDPLDFFPNSYITVCLQSVRRSSGISGVLLCKQANTDSI